MQIVILAGGRCSAELASETGAEWRADVPIGEETVLERVLRAVESLGPVLQVGGSERPGVTRVEPGASFVGSLRNALEAASAEELLIVTADLPDLQKSSLVEFLEKCVPSAALNYPIVPAHLCQAAYPNMSRTTLALREGVFTGGNVALVRASLLRQALPVLEAAYEQRKHPLALARIVGLGLLARVALGKLFPATLPLAALESAVGRFLGVPVHAVPCELPDIGADLDSAEQYRAYLDLRRTPSSADR